MGFSLYCYIEENIKIDKSYIDKMVKLNGILGSSDISVVDALKIIDIDILSDNFSLKILNSVENQFVKLNENMKSKHI